jgi:hypothetical protein
LWKCIEHFIDVLPISSTTHASAIFGHGHHMAINSDSGNKFYHLSQNSGEAEV